LKGVNIEFKVGQGYDAHRFETGRRLVIGGVDIKYEKGLAGHSDADVLVHAIMDSLLGAAGMGDIGVHFPDDDPRWRGANSVELLEKVTRLLQDKGWWVNNVDCTVVAERPKLAPYIDAMRENLAKAMQTTPENVNVKATTTEGMGFAGEGMGMEAYAVASIIKRG